MFKTLEGAMHKLTFLVYTIHEQDPERNWQRYQRTLKIVRPDIPTSVPPGLQESLWLNVSHMDPRLLELYKVNRTIRAFIRNSMGLWGTILVANFKPIAQVTIKCRIYQGVALSPLLFSIGLNPLSQIINKTRIPRRKSSK